MINPTGDEAGEKFRKLDGDLPTTLERSDITHAHRAELLANDVACTLTRCGHTKSADEVCALAQELHREMGVQNIFPANLAELLAAEVLFTAALRGAWKLSDEELQLTLVALQKAVAERLKIPATTLDRGEWLDTFTIENGYKRSRSGSSEQCVAKYTLSSDLYLKSSRYTTGEEKKLDWSWLDELGEQKRKEQEREKALRELECQMQAAAIAIQHDALQFELGPTIHLQGTRFRIGRESDLTVMQLRDRRRAQREKASV